LAPRGRVPHLRRKVCEEVGAGGPRRAT
jgi:hypothetical protein